VIDFPGSTDALCPVDLIVVPLIIVEGYGHVGSAEFTHRQR
jgi:hypothetical protein